MAQYEAFETGVEVNGKTALSVVDGVPSAFEQKALDILADNGIEDPDPESWYPQQAWLDAFAEIDERIGESTLNQIGKSIPDNAEWPAGVESVVGGLESINEAYQMNHRGGDIGHYDAEVKDDTTVHVECKNPYACAFDRGIVEATAREFIDSAVATISEIGDECRADGGDVCLYEVSW
jgi:hypothetical protein